MNVSGYQKLSINNIFSDRNPFVYKYLYILYNILYTIYFYLQNKKYAIKIMIKYIAITYMLYLLDKSKTKYKSKRIFDELFIKIMYIYKNNNNKNNQINKQTLNYFI